MSMLPQPYPVRQPTNGMAIAALVTALLGMVVVPIVLGHMAVREIRRTDEAGMALAVVGLVLGYLELLAVLVALGVAGWAVWFAVSRG